MTDWEPAELAMIAAADDLHISPFRADGTTYGTPTWIWSVVVKDALYVRAYNGTASRWYQSAIQQRAGRIHVAGTEHEVRFSPADASTTAEVDAAYKSKYAGSAYLPPMVTERTQAATVRIDPA